MQNPNSVCFAAQIGSIEPIEGADKIEVARIGGWNCIVPKDQFTAGAVVIIATTDAVIPQELSASMNITSYLRSGTRVRTVKLRGVYSECLIIPSSHVGITSLTEGEDLMEKLGIYKYEPPVKMMTLGNGVKIKYRDNPNFPVYMKFPNAKNVPDLFDKTDYVTVTRKLHGTNARYGIVKKLKLTLWERFLKLVGLADEWIEYEYVYGSHNVQKGSDTNGYYGTDVWQTVASKYLIKHKLWTMVKRFGKEQIGDGVVLYGEIYGPGIQKNYDYGREDLTFSAFDIWMNREYMEYEKYRHTCKYVLGLPSVEVLYNSIYNQSVIDELVSQRFSTDPTKDTAIPHEGVVVRSWGHVKPFKIAKFINPEYLIYAEKHHVGDSH